MKKIKVLIVSVLAGSGHNSAADLLAQLLNKDARFEVVRYTNPSKMMDSTYNGMTKFTPMFHNLFVHHSPRFTSDLINIGKIDYVSDAIKQLKLHKPDIVLATHFTMAYSYRIAQWITRFYPINICAFLDYGKQVSGTIPFNIFLRSDYSLVYDEKAFSHVKQLAHQDPKYILMGGHDCRDEFKKSAKQYANKELAREALKQMYSEGFYQQISTTKTTILIAGGGGGTIQKTYKLLEKIASEQKDDLKLIDNYQFFIICGQNQKYYEKLVNIRNTKLSWQNIFPFAWLDATKYALIQISSDYPVLFGIAPATMHELLETDCGPLLVHKVRADHEFENVAFVKTHKLGVYEGDAEIVADKVHSKFDILKKEKFTQRSKEILNIEAERLQQLPDKLVEISQNKNMHAEQIYKVAWWKVVVSGGFVIVTVIVYYVTKVLVWLAEIISKLKKHFVK